MIAVHTNKNASTNGNNVLKQMLSTEDSIRPHHAIYYLLRIMWNLKMIFIEEI